MEVVSPDVLFQHFLQLSQREQIRMLDMVVNHTNSEYGLPETPEEEAVEPNALM